MTTSIRICPGINDQVFKTLKQEVRTWKERKKYCSIIFDEIPLPPGLNYDKTRDVINGFVQERKTNKFADHVVIFMIRGAVLEWHQPIAFYFSEGSINPNVFKIIMKQIVAAVVDAGLAPVALICDEKASFQSALESLTADTTTTTTTGKPDGAISLSGQDLSIIYDPFHLLKGTRNAFVTKNILDDGNISKWDDIVEVYKIQCNNKKSRVLPKLRDRHVLPNKIDMKKMETSIPVLSNQVAAILAFTSSIVSPKNGQFVSRTFLNTSKTVCFFDKLLDSCNGSALKTSKRKQLRQAVTIYSQHHFFWQEAIEKLENIRFVDKESEEVTVLPTLKNWVVTVKSLQRLWEYFKSKKITTMRPAYFNCIPINDFFRQMRQNYRKNLSGCQNFISKFKSLLPEEMETENEFERHRDRFYVHSRAYVVGWQVKKMLNYIKCDICQNNLTTEQGCSYREFKLFQENELTHPSKHAMRYFGIIEKETNKFLDKKPHENNISKKIKDTLLGKYSIDFLTCDEHKTLITRYFVSFIITFTISNWCNVINKILNGKNVLSLSNVNSLTNMQRKAEKKYRNRLKNIQIGIYQLLSFHLNSKIMKPRTRD